MKIRKCIYTAIIGNYDNLYTSIDNSKKDGWDYICFTNNKELKSSFWKIIYVKKPLDLSDVKFARNIKIEWYKWVLNYEINIWKDANIIINCDLDNFLTLKEENNDMLIYKHWQRNCLYKEGEELIRLRYLSLNDIKTQLNNYFNDNYPKNNGLVETGIIIRKNTENNINFSKKWWGEIKKYTHRDQLSFNYVLWKEKLDIKIKFIESGLRNNKYFTLKLHK